MGVRRKRSSGKNGLPAGAECGNLALVSLRRCPSQESWLPGWGEPREEILDLDALREELAAFRDFGTGTNAFTREVAGREVAYFANEFWTARQRAAQRLHEVSYRACFKPQLPRFFIERLTRPGERVYDPFLGRGTTLIEAALLDRSPAGCDLNPLAAILCAPRLDPPRLFEVEQRLQSIPKRPRGDVREDLLTFYHPETLAEICALREYLVERDKEGTADRIDRWIRMVATNRLTGHSRGFFSIYTMPPNQAVSIEKQRQINEKRGQTPPRRLVDVVIRGKTRSLMKGLTLEQMERLRRWSKEAVLATGSAEATPEIGSDSVALAVTSPPFLNVVNYRRDNWLRCWFNGIDPEAVGIWHFGKPERWKAAMEMVLGELRRVLRPGGVAAFEVGEVRKGSLLLEDLVVPAGLAAGLTPELVLVNVQEFTKTSNCWGVDNLSKGTNTNRVVIFRKPQNS